MTAKRASIALATTAETAARLRKLGARRVEILSQVALPGQEIERLATVPIHTGSPFRLLSLGRLLHWKGFHLGLEAFARFLKKFPESEYWFIGDGPERPNLERLSQRLGVSDKVRFFGFLPRNEVLRKLAEVDVLVHPSLHDSGGFAIAEAMAAGRPVICLNLGGPALQVTQETGYKIPVRTPSQVVNNIGSALLCLARDPNLKLRMGLAARAKIRDTFSWEKRGEVIRKIYNEICKCQD